MDKYIICISRIVSIDEVEVINNLIDQGWEPTSNRGDLHFMTVKLEKTFEVATYDKAEFDMYYANLKKFYMDFEVEWWDKMPSSDE